MLKFSFVIAVTLVKSMQGASIVDTDIENDNNITNLVQPIDNNVSSTLEVVKSTKLVIQKTCLQEYSSACLKLDLIKIMDRLSSSGPLHLLPGVTLIQKPTESPPSAYINLPLQDSPRLDNHLYKRINNYLRSLSLNIQILDDNVLRGLKKFGEGAAQFFGSENAVTGRKKNNRFHQSFWIAGLISAGTMVAMGMSAMSAMAGKALMTSLLALMLSAFAALKGHNDDKKSTTYEIITRPIITHGHGHKHADVTVADAHVMSGTHTGPSYTYRRSIDHGQPHDYAFVPIIDSRP